MMAPIFYEIGVIFGKGVIKISIRTEVEYGGKKYNSIKELCTEIGVSYSSVSHKFYRTHDIEKAVAYARSVEERKKSLVLWGKQYESLSSMANTFGVNIGSLRARINDKDTLEEIISELLTHEMISFRGKNYKGITELATAYGKDAALVIRRLSYGFELEDALFRPIKEMRKPELQIEYRGITYASKSALYREKGINGNMIYEMTQNLNVEFETAVDIILEFKKRSDIPEEEMISYIPVCIIRGKKYRSIAQLAKDIQIPETALMMYKSRHEYYGILEALCAMQEECVECYVVNDQRCKMKELMNFGYTSTTYKQCPKKLFPRYPQLQGLDFVTDCVDTLGIYNEVKKEYLEQQQSIQMNM